MKPITATPVEITVLRWSENGESFADIAQKPSIIEHLGEKYATPSQRIEKLKRMAKNAGWYQFQLRRAGKELPEPLPRLNETPQPRVQRVDKLPADESTPEIAETATPAGVGEPSKFRTWAELLKTPAPPKSNPMDGARKCFIFPSGNHYEAADAPKNPGALISVHYSPSLKCWVDANNEPLRVYRVDRCGQRGEVLRIVDEVTAEWQRI